MISGKSPFEAVFLTATGKWANELKFIEIIEIPEVVISGIKSDRIFSIEVEFIK